MTRMLYHYRTIATSGSVEVTGTVVKCSHRHRGGAFEQQTPLSDVLPHRTQSTFLTTTFWACFFVGVAGFVCGVWGVLDNAGTNMTMSWALPLSFAGIAMIIFSWRCRTETWVWYPTRIEGHRIQFCKNGPDVASFESFCKDFEHKVETSRTHKRDEQSHSLEPAAGPDSIGTLSPPAQ